MALKWKSALVALWLSLWSANAAMAEIGVSDKEIVIGNPNAQSGDNQFSGKETTIGLMSYINEINAEGGVHGRKIKLVTCDDRYEVDGAFSCFQQMVDRGVFAITGLVGSALLAKYIPLCTNNKMPMVGAYSGPQFVTTPAKRYIFTTRLGYRDEEQQFVDHMFRDAGIKRIAIIYQNDSYGADHLQGLTDALKKYNATVAAAASYKRNTLDVAEAFNTVKAANPQAVSLAANNRQCAAIIKMAHDANWHPVFFINSGANVDGFLELAGKEANGVLVSETVPSPNHTEAPLIAKYQKALKQSYPSEKPCFTSLRGYIDGLVLVEGLKRAGRDVTREKFVEALYGINKMDIGLGKGLELNYGQEDHAGLHKYAFGTVSNGDIVPVVWKNLTAAK